MQARKILKFIFIVSLCGCKSGRIDIQKNQNSKSPASFSLAEKNDRLKGGAIPLDSVGFHDQKLIVESHVDTRDAITLRGFYGLDRQYALVPDTEDLSVHVQPEPVEQFSEYSILSEKSPEGAQENVLERVYNLPDLLERLNAQTKWEDGAPTQKSKLPDGVSIFASGETELTVVITRPTVLSASFSLGRTLKIFNRSKLVLIVPLMENVFLQQAKLPGSSEIPSTEIHTFSCTKVDKESIVGTIQHFKLSESEYGNPRMCDSNLADPDFGITTPGLSMIKIEPWMPQVLVTQRLRNEDFVKSYSRWAKLFPASIIRFNDWPQD